MTKLALTEYLRMFRMAFDICGNFTIINDIINPSSNSDVSETIGAHRIRHPKFSVMPGIIYTSVPNITEVVNCVRNTTRVKTIKVINTETELLVRLDYEEYVLATATGRTDSTKTFDDIINTYMKSCRSLSKDELSLAKAGKVVTLIDPDYGPVRISKSSLPFMGVSRNDAEPNFSGTCSFGYYDKDINENYVALHINYKICEAFHMYVYVPYTID